MTLRYPKTAGGTDSDYVIFTPVKYKANNGSKGEGNSGFSSSNEGGAPPVADGAQSVILYMPNSTPAMGNQNDWNKLDFNGPIGDLRREISQGAGASMAKFMSGGSSPEVLEKAMDGVSGVWF